MALYVVRRLLVNVLVFVLISVGIFSLVRLAPGDPVRMMVNPEQMQSGGAAFIEAKRHELGLDRPIVVQYGNWLADAVRGDLGYSYVGHRPVSAVLGERVGPTLQLMGAALVVALVVAIALGVAAAVRRNSAVDYGATVIGLTAVSVPPFFLGIVGIYVFSLKLGWLPSAGMTTPGDGGPLDQLHHLILPGLILAFVTAGPFTRYVRGGLVDELGADYVRTAEAKGAGPVRVVLRHALRNSLIPLITVVMYQIPQMLAGAVVIEQVFAWPGMGQLAVSSIGQHDYPVIVGFALYVAVLVLICNLVADLLYAAVDPRVSLR
ncbi:ABC transporter permease [Actinomadura sp. WMMB 499]|uniref:ABC transporter permease n=1 Tax=Actinomadura sp. WMMB 499 TaxID=1219491 RepID=UPI001246ACA3|nr:ABC transporter permease [Actinomadura sp. WMMB 499]QFG21606.1 ABC transporter permease [Actinomadura sp. WMMB 499]